MKHWRKVVALGVALGCLPAVLGPTRKPANGEPYRYLSFPYGGKDQRNKGFLSFKPRHVAIIGGHLAGCIAAKTMLQQGLAVTIFEKKLSLGEDAEMGVWSTPDFPGALEAKDEFLLRYIHQFGLGSSLLMGHEVQSIAQQPNGSWIISTPNKKFTFNFLIIAGGFCKVPTPRFANSHRFNGQIYANESPPYAKLAGKEVVVIGPQETAVIEISRLCEAGAKVVYVFPKGESVKNRSWLTDWLQSTRLGEIEAEEEMNMSVESFFSSKVDTLLTFLHNQWLPKEVQVQSYAKARLSTSSLFDFVPYLTSKQLTILRGSVSSADDDLLYLDLKKVRCDAVVITPRFEINSFGLLKDQDERLYRRSIKPGVKDLAFIGQLSGPMKPTLINLQAKWLLDVLRGRVMLPSAEHMKSLNNMKEGYRFADSLLEDCGIAKYRRPTWVKEWVQQMKAEDYSEVVTHST